MKKSGFQQTSAYNTNRNEFFDLEIDAAPQEELDSNVRSPHLNQNPDFCRFDQIPGMISTHCTGLSRQKPRGDELVDVVIVYAKDDYEDMLNFMGWLQSLLNTEGIYDCRIVPFDDEQFCQDKVQNVEDVVSKATHAFMFLTSNFVRDVHLGFYNCEAIAQTRLAQGPDASRFATLFLLKNKYAVRPVHTERASSRRYRTPPGLNSLMSIDFYDKHTKHTQVKTKQLLKNAIEKRKMQEKELRFEHRKNVMYEQDAQRHSEYGSNESSFQVRSVESIQRLQQHKLDLPRVIEQSIIGGISPSLAYTENYLGFKVTHGLTQTSEGKSVDGDSDYDSYCSTPVSLPLPTTPNLQETLTSQTDTRPRSYSSLETPLNESKIATNATSACDEVQRSNQDLFPLRDSNNPATVSLDENESPSSSDGISLPDENGSNTTDNNVSDSSYSSVPTGIADKLQAESKDHGSGQFLSGTLDVKSIQLSALDQFQKKTDIGFTSNPLYKKFSTNIATPSFIDHQHALSPDQRDYNTVKDQTVASFQTHSIKQGQIYFPENWDLPNNDSLQADGCVSGSLPVGMPQRVETPIKQGNDKKTVHIHHYHDCPPPAKRDIKRDDRVKLDKAGMNRGVRNSTTTQYNVIGCNVVQIGSSNSTRQLDNAGSTRDQINLDRTMTTKECISRNSITNDKDEDHEQDIRSFIKTDGNRSKRNDHKTETRMKTDFRQDQYRSDSVIDSETLSNNFNIQPHDVNKLKNNDDFQGGKIPASGHNLKSTDISNFELSRPVKRHSSFEKQVIEKPTDPLDNCTNKIFQTGSFTKFSSGQPWSLVQTTTYDDHDLDWMNKGQNLKSNPKYQSVGERQADIIKEKNVDLGDDMDIVCENKEKLKSELDIADEKHPFTNKNTDCGDFKVSIFKDKDIKLPSLRCEFDEEEQSGRIIEKNGDCVDGMTGIFKDQYLKNSTLQYMEGQPYSKSVDSDVADKRNHFKVGYIFHVDYKYTPGCLVQRQISTCPPLRCVKEGEIKDTNDSDDVD